MVVVWSRGSQGHFLGQRGRGRVCSPPEGRGFAKRHAVEEVPQVVTRDFLFWREGGRSGKTTTRACPNETRGGKKTHERGEKNTHQLLLFLLRLLFALSLSSLVDKSGAKHGAVRIHTPTAVARGRRTAPLRCLVSAFPCCVARSEPPGKCVLVCLGACETREREYRAFCF